MSDEINVIVVKRKGRNLFLRYTDPVDGKRREKNSGTTDMKTAQRVAVEWQTELRAGIPAFFSSKELELMERITELETELEAMVLASYVKIVELERKPKPTTGKKRPNGAGSISQRSDGRWMARLSVGFDELGKRKRKVLYGKTQEEVQKKLQASKAFERNQ